MKYLLLTTGIFVTLIFVIFLFVKIPQQKYKVEEPQITDFQGLSLSGIIPNTAFSEKEILFPLAFDVFFKSSKIIEEAS